MWNWWGMAFLLASRAPGAVPADWEVHTPGEAWQVRVEPRLSFQRGRAEQGWVVSFPAHTGSEPVEIHYFPPSPDLPLPALPPNLDWTPTANIVQPWGPTQWVAVTEHRQWAPRLAEEFGFNAIIMLPPEAHNAITAEEHHITEEEFQAALAGYRRAGFRFILYSAIMHCGHAPVWQSGQLTRAHPEWSQRDRDGVPVTVYGAEWLCPNTPALDFTLNYTRDLVQRYGADGVMLDNQEFFRSDAGQPTCYCDDCQRKFRRYVQERFGLEGLQRVFGLSPEEVRIPTEPGDLFRLWIHWRNRVWGEAMGTFRAKLREVKPDLVLLANTAYDWGDWLLATDLQYRQEDAVLSESRGLTSRGMAGKMQLGQALGAGRPLWNYIGTFQEQDFTRLRDPATIEGLLAATLAHRANPWIVFYGFAEHPQENAASQAVLRKYLRFFREHAAAFAAARPYAEVLSLLSLRARNYLRTPLQPPHLALLRDHHIPVETALDTDLPELDLTRFGVIVAEGSACLSEAEAEILGDWVEEGGILLATPDVGGYDEIGRLREESVLWSVFPPLPDVSEKGSPVRSRGRGWVLKVETPLAIWEALVSACPPLVSLTPSAPEWEVVPYHLPGENRLLVHCLWHGSPEAVPETVLGLRLPPGFTPRKAAWHWPGSGEGFPDAVKGSASAGRVRLALPQGRIYALLVLEGEI